MYGVEFHLEVQHWFAFLQELWENNGYKNILERKPIQMVTNFGRIMIPKIPAIPRTIGLLKTELITGKRHQNQLYAI